MDLWCKLDHFQVLEQIPEHKTGVTKTANLYSYLRFCGNIMCTAGPNDNLWLTKISKMDTNSCDIPNDSIFALFWAIGVVEGPRGGKIEKWRGCRSLPILSGLLQVTQGVFAKKN